jgi:hypothetical protein
LSDPEDDDLPLTAALRDLVQSDGWKWFCQMVDAEFGPPGIARRLNTIRADLPRGPGREFDLTAKVDALYEAADVVNALIKRPKDEIAKMTKKQPERLYDKFRRTVETHR